MAWSLPNIPTGISAQLGYFLKWLSRPEDWTDVSFQNSWDNFAGAASYYKDPLGVVHIRGHVDTGSSATVAFTLPTGYRIEQNAYFTCVGVSGAAGNFLYIQTDGTVTVTRSSTDISINGISFRAT